MCDSLLLTCTGNTSLPSKLIDTNNQKVKGTGQFGRLVHSRLSTDNKKLLYMYLTLVKTEVVVIKCLNTEEHFS